MFTVQEKRSLRCMLEYQQKSCSRGKYPLCASHYKPVIFCIWIFFYWKDLRISCKKSLFEVLIWLCCLPKGPWIPKSTLSNKVAVDERKKWHTDRGGRRKDWETAQGKPRSEVLKLSDDPPWNRQKSQERRTYREKCYVLTRHPCTPLVSFLKGLDVFCYDFKGKGIWLERVKLSLGKT